MELCQCQFITHISPLVYNPFPPDTSLRLSFFRSISLPRSLSSADASNYQYLLIDSIGDKDGEGFCCGDSASACISRHECWQGDAGITSTFIRSRSIHQPISLLTMKCLLFQRVTMHPSKCTSHKVDYDGKAVIISCGIQKSAYGTTEGKYDFTARGSVTNYSFYEYNSGYIHHCLVDGLEAFSSTTQITTQDWEGVPHHLENFGFKLLLRLIQMLRTILVLLVIWARHTTLFRHLSSNAERRPDCLVCRRSFLR
ncbi:hypothetical protein Cgig2_027825 [Carnegiea gigantea]|uniref:Uncharacterized protein n=1 Tax=Carnegiea gigantea TaxID=171969 RepID=A0A9Q1QAI2_9CARY|nr:hypothetical protein Cgig2_027825 [Carnegiea gigantea]